MVYGVRLGVVMDYGIFCKLDGVVWRRLYLWDGVVVRNQPRGVGLGMLVLGCVVCVWRWRWLGADM